MNGIKWALFWDGFIDLLFASGALYLVLIVVSILWEVTARNLGLYSPIWLGTFTEFGMLIAAMLAAPKLVRDRGHVSMELIDSLLPPRALRIVVLITDSVAACVSLVVLWYCATAGWTAFVRGEVDIMTVNVPRWILFAVLSLGFLLCAIEFARHIGKASRATDTTISGDFK